MAGVSLATGFGEGFGDISAGVELLAEEDGVKTEVESVSMTTSGAGGLEVAVVVWHSGELGQELRGEIGGVGGIGGKSAGVSFRTCCRGVILRTSDLETKVNGFPPSCTSALGGGVDSTKLVSDPTPYMLSSRAAASLSISGGMSSSALSSGWSAGP